MWLWYLVRRRGLLELPSSSLRALEMAIKFPHCDVLGIDLAPVPIEEGRMPPNCRFEIKDVNLGLPHYHLHFDVIHVRCIGSGVSPYDSLYECPTEATTTDPFLDRKLSENDGRG